MFRRALVAALVLSVLPLTAGADAASPAPFVVVHQGRLLGDGDAPVHGEVTLTVRFHDTAVPDPTKPATSLWEETYQATCDQSGIYTVLLGEAGSAGKKPLDPAIFDGRALFLGVSVNGSSELLPRLHLGFAPYAQVASSALVSRDLACARPGCVDASDLGAASVTRDALAPAAVTLEKLALTGGKFTGLDVDLLDGISSEGFIRNGASPQDASLNLTGDVVAGRLHAGGELVAATATIGGAAQVDSLTATNGVGAATVTASGLVKGDALAATKGLTAATATISGAAQVDSLAATKGLTAATATISGAAQVDSLAATKGLTAATATISGAAQVDSLTVAKGFSAGSLTTSGAAQLGATSISGNASVAGSLVVGGASPAASAALDVQSTTRGFLPPRLTTAQRDGIAAPDAGLTIFNTTTKELNYFDGSAWRSTSSGFGVRRANVTLANNITYHQVTPTTDYPLANVPANTKAIIVGVYYLHNGGANHGYLRFSAYQRGKAANGPDSALFENYHFDWYYNSDYYEEIVPWDKSLNDDTLRIQVLESYNTSTNNTYTISLRGYVTAN